VPPVCARLTRRPAAGAGFGNPFLKQTGSA